MTTYPQNLIGLRVAVERERKRKIAQRPSDPYANDAAGWITDCCLIDNAQPGDGMDSLSAIPFTLWDAQRDLLRDILGNPLLIILKARQLGISWLVCAYALWLCLYHASRLVLFFSIGQGEANEMMRRVGAIYWRLPEPMRARLPQPIKDNTEELRFDNGSAIQSLPSGKTSGSGYTASLIVLDEFAKNANAESLYTAVKPTIDGGGKMIILSSANGAGNLFYQLVDKARQGLGRFVFRFLPWHVRPGRDVAWYAAVAADAIDESHHKQEYPATPDEAFEATEVDAFLPSIELWKACKGEYPAATFRDPCVMALDGSVSGDTFMAVLVSRDPRDATKVVERYTKAWDPKGSPLGYGAIEAELREVLARFNVVQVAYDPYQLHYMAERLGDTVWCDPFSQAGPRLTADRQLLDVITQRRIAHMGTPILEAHLANANRQVDEDNHRLRIVKRTAEKRIDGAVCLSMAVARCLELAL